MSLVNQMLKDLDRRQVNSPGDTPPNQEWPARGDESTRRFSFAQLPWMTLAAAVGTGGFFLWQGADRTPDHFYVLDQPAVLMPVSAAQADSRPVEVTRAASTPYLPVDIVVRESLRDPAPVVVMVKPETDTPVADDPARTRMVTYDHAANGVFAPSHGVDYTWQDSVPDLETAVQTAGNASVVPETAAPRTTRLSRSAVTTEASLLPASLDDIADHAAESSSIRIESSVSITPASGAAERSYRKARHYLDDWNTTAATTELERTLVFDPGHSAARELLGTLLLQQGDLVSAEPLIESGIILSPGYSPFVQLKARILSSRGEYAAAIGALESITPRDDHRLDHDSTLAALYQQSGKHEQAVGVYLRLIENFPDKSSLWSGLAISLDAQGEYEAALKSYQHALDDHALAPELRRYAQRRVTALRDTVSGEQS